MSDEKSLQDDLNEMLGDAKEEVKKAADRVGKKLVNLQMKPKKHLEEQRKKPKILQEKQKKRQEILQEKQKKHLIEQQEIIKKYWQEF